ncbi:Rossmann-like and DUF2520 domain-containing protein [Anaerofustis stercorihominis]|uniref:Rossmann-like and DUF2520 domain-containing protein n=1 Tax=Anaerofustis stercorihominis TaxID=214853 RepID=UPI00214CB246|nr:Rossmann-like and DUF2520 domain-containing protein [Anaerofustis stercorihominis]MCR2032514.1 DUF2520 domain-containing protein [Anaerofustis stercorihominis]
MASPKEGGRMKIGFVGAGKVGVSLGKYFKLHKKDVIGYYSKNPDSAREAAKFTDTDYFSTLYDILNSCDALFLTVPDKDIGMVWESLKDFEIQNKIFCHCSGALSSAVFQKGDREVLGYSIHPMYAFNDKYTSYKELSNAYFTIEGNKKYLDFFKCFFESMGNPVKIISEDNKSKYHASCVYVSNLVIALVNMGADLLIESGFKKEEAIDALMPLFMNNANNIAERGLIDSLTGPIERNDITTVMKHLDVLSNEAKDIYKLLSLGLIDIAEEKNENTDYGNIKKILKEE